MMMKIYLKPSWLAQRDGYIKEDLQKSSTAPIIETLTGGAPMSAGIAMRVLNLLRNPAIFSIWFISHKGEDFDSPKEKF
jgi:hypothetical protein